MVGELSHWRAASAAMLWATRMLVGVPARERGAAARDLLPVEQTIQDREEGQVTVNRREFLRSSLAATLASASGFGSAEGSAAQGAPRYTTADQGWQAAYDKALEVLRNNVQLLPGFDRPLLIEGAEYAGVWQECGPHEALVYRRFRGDVARNNHMVFFKDQRADGQLPASHKRSETGFGQIQMVVPIAATAWELAIATRDEELLETAYSACSRWDAWLMRYRNTRGTGLVEGFCTYDTGMDNSPRWAKMANQCPHKDAKICPQLPGLPRLSPDLSATVYGARVALAEMALALNKSSEAEQWREKANGLRKLILNRLYVGEDAAFYDLDAENRFVKVRTCVITRVCGEHVLDQALFDELWERQLHRPEAFWAPYPFPSVALDDASFVRPIPRNSWGGASQALTALRTSRWMDFYNRSAEHGLLMERWGEALVRDMSFRQQLDPATGVFTQGGSANYSPAALVLGDFTWRLAGIYEQDQEIHWNVRPGHPAAKQARFAVRTDGGNEVTMSYGRSGDAALHLGGKLVAHIEGGCARLITDKHGRPQRLVGISNRTEQITVRARGATRRFTVNPNTRVEWGA